MSHFNSHFVPYMRYINEFMRTHCAPDLLAWGLFPNAKEITESFGAYNAVRKWLVHHKPVVYACYTVPPFTEFNDDHTRLIVVGDGNTPRTAALFAARSKWDCYSVDPRLKDKHYPIKRLTTCRVPIESFTMKTDNPVIIVAVHSHAELEVAIENIQSPKRAVVAIPCCKKQDIKAKRPDIEYFDFGIASPQNKVKVWLNV